MRPPGALAGSDSPCRSSRDPRIARGSESTTVFGLGLGQIPRIWESALGGTRTHGLSLRRAALYPTELQAQESNNVTRLRSEPVMVPKEGFEPTHPFGYYVLNVARLPFRHFGTALPRGGRSRT